MGGGQVLDVFSELVSTYGASISNNIVPLVHFCLEVLRCEDLQNTTRDVAGMVVTALAQYKPKLLGKKNLVPDIVATLLQVMAICQDNAAGELLSSFYRGEEGEDDEDDPDYEGGPSGQDIAQQCLDALALHVPSKYFYQPTMALIAQGLDSADHNMRKAGTAALAVIVEGCSVRPPPSSLLPHLLPSSHPSPHTLPPTPLYTGGHHQEPARDPPPRGGIGPRPRRLGA